MYLELFHFELLEQFFELSGDTFFSSNELEISIWFIALQDFYAKNWKNVLPGPHKSFEGFNVQKYTY